jgi:hypothetical protein
MRRTISPRLSAFTALSVACVIGHAQQQTTAAYAPTAWGGTTPIAQSAQGLGVPAGEGPIEQALVRIIPPPYIVQLDAAVSKSIVLKWENAPLWNTALDQALLPHGLRSIPDWSRNTVTITNRPTVVASTASLPAGLVGGATSTSAPPLAFAVLESDSTVREVLLRWSKSAGWIHQAEHWTIDRDLPILGSADASVFGADYKQAVRTLLASTELTNRPVQPCFYSNRVMRVIPKMGNCFPNNPHSDR